MSRSGEVFLGMPTIPSDQPLQEVGSNFDFSELKDYGNVNRIGELNPYVTLACDLRCDYCYIYPFLQKARDVSELMSRRFLNALMDHLIEDGGSLDRMTLLGGEPTLHPEITDMVNDAAEREIEELRMTTNGVGLHSLDLGRLRPGAFDHVSVSIDGIDAATNDSTRGQGTFKRITRTMQEYADAGIPLSVNYTVTNNNLRSLNETPDFFKQHGVSILNFHRASMSGNSYNNPELIVGPEDWTEARDNLLAHIRSDPKRYKGLTFRVPYTFLTQEQMNELGYKPIQDNNYHSPNGGHRLIVLPPTEKGKGLCYMSSDLIGEPNGELGTITPEGKFRWNHHPDNELTAYRRSGTSANISTVITGQEQLEHNPNSTLLRVSHSFKEKIKY